MRFLHDLRFALRGFRRNLGLTVVTVLVLALGIGANTAIFSVVDALVLRPLPFPAPHELVAIPDGVMYLDFVDLRAQARSFRGLALYRPNRELLATDDAPEVVNAVSASADLFAVLGVQPRLGRGFAPGEDGRGRVAVVSHDLWQRQLGSDPDAVGRTLMLDGQIITVIGVTAPGSAFPSTKRPAISGSRWATRTGPSASGAATARFAASDDWPRGGICAAPRPKSPPSAHTWHSSTRRRTPAAPSRSRPTTAR